MNIANIFIFLILSLTISFHFVHAQILYTWSQVIPENKLSIRAIIDNNMCPIAYVDDKEVEMLSRSSINNTETVCELIVETNAQNISLDNIKVPVLAKRSAKLPLLVIQDVE